MEQAGVSSSINIENLRNAFNYHVKCGEIYYLQPVNEVLIICNICNNENFDKYENFLDHFNICYKKSKKYYEGEDSVNRATNTIVPKQEVDYHIMDIVPPHLSESDDDDESSNHEKDENINTHLIPTIEINDSDTESEKISNASLKNKAQSEDNTNKNQINKSKLIDKTIDVKMEVIEEQEKINRQAEMSENSTENGIFMIKNENIVLPDESQITNVENVAEPIQKLTNLNQQDTNSKDNSYNNIPSNTDSATIFPGLLPHVRPFVGECSLPLIGKLSKYNQFINPKYMKSDKRPHQCPECGKCFAQRINLVTHFRTHTGEKPYKCTMCNNAYPQKSNLDAHMLKHTGIRPYGCEDCGKRFFQMSHLLAHERTHTGERPYDCAECDRKFSQLGHLLSHKRNTHSNEQFYKCNLCSLQFVDQNILNQHQLTHISETLLEFNSTNNFKELINSQEVYLTQNLEKNKSITNMNVIGKNNGIVVQPSQTNYDHEKVIKEEEDKLEYKKRLILQQQQEQLDLHNSPSNDNSNEESIRRTFDCQYCDKKFHQSNHLANHQRTHEIKSKRESPAKLKFKLKYPTTGMKRKHECDDCGKKFALVTELKSHQRRSH